MNYAYLTMGVAVGFLLGFFCALVVCKVPPPDDN